MNVAVAVRVQNFPVESDWSEVNPGPILQVAVYGNSCSYTEGITKDTLPCDAP